MHRVYRAKCLSCGAITAWLNHPLDAVREARCTRCPDHPRLVVMGYEDTPALASGIPSLECVPISDHVSATARRLILSAIGNPSI